MATLEDKDLDKDKSKAEDKDSAEVVIIEGEDDDQDASLAKDKDSGQDDHDDDDRRLRNRDARRKRKERQRQLWERNRFLETQNQGLQDALNQVNTRLAKLEQGTAEDHEQRLDRTIRGNERALETAKAELKRAMEAQDHDAVVRANEAIAQITVDRRTLQESQERLAAAKADREKDKDRADRKDASSQDRMAPEMERTVLRNISIFARRNPWYNPQGRDEDSVKMREIDADVAADGYDPSTAEYWQEVEARAAEEMPHRFKKGGKTNGKDADGDEDDEDDDGKDRRNGKHALTAGSGRNGRTGNGREGAYRLSRERVEAIKEAGKWDDPAERAKMIDAYKKYDREHGRGQ